jgi:hypothetical protein
VRETLGQIHGPNFTAGIIILRDDKVIEAAPIVHDMKRGKWRSPAEYCGQMAGTSPHKGPPEAGRLKIPEAYLFDPRSNGCFTGW